MNIKNIAYFCIGTLVIVGLIFVIYINQIGLSMKKDMESTRDAILKADLVCPENTKEASAPWSKGGYSRYCVKGEIFHGKWIAWEHQKKSIEGYYREGKKHGQWNWYGEDGQIFKMIEYKNGEEIAK